MYVYTYLVLSIGVTPPTIFPIYSIANRITSTAKLVDKSRISGMVATHFQLTKTKSKQTDAGSNIGGREFVRWQASRLRFAGR